MSKQTPASKIGLWLYRNRITAPGVQYMDATVYMVNGIIGGNNFVGQAIGNNIFISIPPDEWLLRHEYAHVLQWRRFGGLGFLIRYGWGFLHEYIMLLGDDSVENKRFEAYRRIPLEIEARAAERD